MLITNANHWEIGTRKRTVVQEIKLGPLSMKFATIALLAVAALFYLTQSTQSATQKYKIMQLGDTRKELEAQTRDLEVEAARLKSLNEIKKSSQNLDLEPAGQINYQSGANHT